GVYYLKGGGFIVSGSGSVTGTGVLIINAPNSAADTITFSGQGSVNLTPSNSLSGVYAAYNGITLFQDPASTAALNLTGQGNLTISGVLYAPKALLTITGQDSLIVNSDAVSKRAAVIVYDVRVTGSGGLTINVNSSNGYAGAFQLANDATSDVSAAISNWI